MSVFQIVNVRSMVKAASSVKTGVSFVIGKNTENGKDLKASFRLDGAHLTETEIVRELDRLETANALLPVSDRTVIRMNLPKFGGAALTISVRPVYTPGALSSLLRGLDNIHVEAEPKAAKKGKAKADDAAAPESTPAGAGVTVTA